MQLQWRTHALSWSERANDPLRRSSFRVALTLEEIILFKPRDREKENMENSISTKEKLTCSRALQREVIAKVVSAVSDPTPLNVAHAFWSELGCARA